MTDVDSRRDLLARLAISLVALFLAGLLAILSVFHHYTYSHVMAAYIEQPLDKHFADWSVTPDALSCWARGVIVYLPNECTLTFNYSPVFLLLPAPPGGPFWNVVFGFMIAGTFLASLTLLAPPRARFEFVVRLLATVSPGVALGIERGNIDLILFVLLLLGSLALARRGAAGVASYGLFIAATLLKFYPAAALFLAVRERPVRFAAVCLAALAAVAWLFIAFRAELAVILHNLPDGNEWTMEFKGRALAGGVATALARVAALRPYAPAADAGLRLLAVAAMAGGAVALWRACIARGAALPGRQATLLPMLSGAAVTLFCFVSGQSYIYRGIYVLPILPGLFAIARTAPPAIARIVEGTCLFMAAAFWMPVVRWAGLQLGLWDHQSVQGVLWLGYQLGWWWIATVLSAVLFAFFAVSPIGATMLRALPGRPLPAVAAGVSRG